MSDMVHIGRGFLTHMKKVLLEVITSLGSEVLPVLERGRNVSLGTCSVLTDQV